MDLRQLDYVVAVADHGSFTRAAQAVHVAQPSLSHGIRSLEAELGVQLFARLGRSVAITAAGERVIEAARRVHREMADLTSVARAVASLETGELTMAVVPTLAVDPLAPLIGRFRRAHPGIRIRIEEPESTADIERAVRDGRAELGLTDVTTTAPGLVRTPLFRQELVALCPPDQPPPDEALTARALVQLPLIATAPGTSTRRLLDRLVARTGREPDIAVEVHRREAIVALVLAGAGTALLPRPMAEAAAARGAMVRRLQPPLHRRVGLLHRPTPRSPAAEAMVRLTISALRPDRR
ncbi:MAG: LysR substrate-binding domain-containing protein [Acidimicrobiales bacterium]